MNSTSWLQYFESNRLKRAEPQWHLPLPETGAVAAKLARSLSHFALGESGDDRFLLDEAQRYVYSSTRKRNTLACSENLSPVSAVI